MRPPARTDDADEYLAWRAYRPQDETEFQAAARRERALLSDRACVDELARRLIAGEISGYHHRLATAPTPPSSPEVFELGTFHTAKTSREGSWIGLQRVCDTPRLVEMLGRALEHKSAGVRASAAEFARTWKQPKALPLLEAALAREKAASVRAILEPIVRSRSGSWSQMSVVERAEHLRRKEHADRYTEVARDEDYARAIWLSLRAHHFSSEPWSPVPSLGGDVSPLSALVAPMSDPGAVKIDGVSLVHLGAACSEPLLALLRARSVDLGQTTTVAWRAPVVASESPFRNTLAGCLVPPGSSAADIAALCRARLEQLAAVYDAYDSGSARAKRRAGLATYDRTLRDLASDGVRSRFASHAPAVSLRYDAELLRAQVEALRVASAIVEPVPDVRPPPSPIVYLRALARGLPGLVERLEGLPTIRPLRGLLLAQGPTEYEQEEYLPAPARARLAHADILTVEGADVWFLHDGDVFHAHPEGMWRLGSVEECLDRIIEAFGASPVAILRRTKKRSRPLAGMVAVMTGNFDDYELDEVECRLRDRGATFHRRLDEKVTHLLVGDRPDEALLTRARELQVQLIRGADLDAAEWLGPRPPIAEVVDTSTPPAESPPAAVALPATAGMPSALRFSLPDDFAPRKVGLVGPSWIHVAAYRQDLLFRYENTGWTEKRASHASSSLFAGNDFELACIGERRWALVVDGVEHPLAPHKTWQQSDLTLRAAAAEALVVAGNFTNGVFAFGYSEGRLGAPESVPCKKPLVLATDGRAIAARVPSGIQVFERDAGSWRETFTLADPWAESVAMHHDTLAVGCPRGEGKVLLYRREATGWQLAREHHAPSGRPNRFGARVGLFGGALVVASEGPVGRWIYPVATADHFISLPAAAQAIWALGPAGLLDLARGKATPWTMTLYELP
ncbi:MAG: BRCT domain-containing protein [Myxococcales bacterium]|nr:BRCT domain-containing protein [Myxococcales bacterium]